MPRATRAALRAQELAEDATTAASIALPPTPNKERVPLGELTNNAIPNNEMARGDDEEGTRKAKGKKKGVKKPKNKKAMPESDEVVQDDSQSTHSDAVDKACDDLMRSGECGNFRV